MKSQTTPQSDRARMMRLLEQTGLYLLLMIGAVISLFPFYWMVSSSLKPAHEMYAWPPTLWPQQFTVDAYRYVWETMDVPRTVFNSTVVAVSQVSLNVFFSSLVGYALAKLVFPGKRYLFLTVLALMILPGQLLIIPLFLQVHRLGLLDTYAGLVLPGAITPFTIFLLRQACLGVPDEYLEPAITDGPNHSHILFLPPSPLIKPLLLTAVLINFYWNWNGFLWPFLVIAHDEMATLPVALARYRTFQAQRLDAVMAAATVVALPIVLVYLVIQRQFVESLTMSGLRG